jgi:dienelactone hydrolase
MVDGISRFLDAETEAARMNRANYWRREFSSEAAYDRSISSNRMELRRIIGALERRKPVMKLELIVDSLNPGFIAKTGGVEVFRVRWPVLEGVTGEGLWLKPKGKARGTIIALPDADQSPEMLCGLELGLPPESQFARELAENGFEVFVPVLINRSDEFSGSAELNRYTNQPHREWIYRQAFELGHHIIGFEVQKVLGLVDWIERTGQKNIGVAGYGEGGLIAFYSAALDPRIKAALVSGYFQPRERLWREPIYRNVFGLLKTFGDAEIASMIAPRPLIIEYSEVPAIDGPPLPRPGRAGAAPGKLVTPKPEQVEAEIARARALFPENFPTRIELIAGPGKHSVLPGSAEALKALCKAFGASYHPKSEAFEPVPGFVVDSEARQKRQVGELVQYVQSLLDKSERFRDEHLWNMPGEVKTADWLAKVAAYKTNLWEEVIGKFPSPTMPMNPRSRLIYDTPRWKGYDVVLDVWPNVFAWGILLVPKDLKANEKRPVVVCQHGLEGVPSDTIDGPEKTSGYKYYKSFSARLADQGFVVFAPHNPYRGEDRFRVLQRKANPLGKSLFSVILGQHEQILNYLDSLSFVDGSRIGFYGLSYGGKTAMRVPALLDRYCLSICSGDFNEWIRKNANTRSSYSYVFSNEYEMPEFNLGNTFNYGDIAGLICPRPFMVERGHHDGVAPDTWVAYEFARAMSHYLKAGVPERAEIEFFDGPHTIHGVGTFKFLHKYLNWPEMSVSAQ